MMDHKNCSSLLLNPEKKIPYICLGSDCPKSCCGPWHGIKELESIFTHQDQGKLIQSPYSETLEDTLILSTIFAQIRVLEKDIIRLRDAGYEDFIERRGAPSHPSYYLRLLQDGTCSALNSDNLCSIHPARPTLCRAFPFYIDLFAGLSIIGSCPGVNSGESTIRDLECEINAVIEMYEFWISNMKSV